MTIWKIEWQDEEGVRTLETMEDIGTDIPIVPQILSDILEKAEDITDNMLYEDYVGYESEWDRALRRIDDDQEDSGSFDEYDEFRYDLPQGCWVRVWVAIHTYTVIDMFGTRREYETEHIQDARDDCDEHGIAIDKIFCEKGLRNHERNS